jgi:hypothetical protein
MISDAPLKMYQSNKKRNLRRLERSSYGTSGIIIFRIPQKFIQIRQENFHAVFANNYFNQMTNQGSLSSFRPLTKWGVHRFALK